MQVNHDLVKVSLHGILGYGSRSVGVQKPNVVEDRFDLFRLTVMALQLPVRLLAVNIDPGNDPAGSGDRALLVAASGREEKKKKEQNNCKSLQKIISVRFLC